MRINTRNRHHLTFIVTSMVISSILGMLISFIRGNPLYRGATAGFLISLFCGMGDRYLFPKLRRLQFTAFLLLQTFYFTTVIIAALIVSGVSGLRTPDFDIHTFYFELLFSLFLAALITFISLINRLLGQKVLLNLFRGKYYRPVEEERILMFLDLKSSTTIAEKLGNRRFHMFLNRIFYEIASPVSDSGGEIYKYLGDGVIISWKPKKGLRNANCVRSFLQIGDIFRSNSLQYEQEFGFVPKFRCGMHIGTVVIGELGDFRKEIALLGDAVNTVARIENECSLREVDCIVSGILLDQLALPESCRVESLGTIELKGKDERVELFSVRYDSMQESLQTDIWNADLAKNETPLTPQETVS